MLPRGGLLEPEQSGIPLRIPRLGEGEGGEDREPAGRAAQQEHMLVNVARLLRPIVPCVDNKAGVAGRPRACLCLLTEAY